MGRYCNHMSMVQYIRYWFKLHFSLWCCVACAIRYWSLELMGAFPLARDSTDWCADAPRCWINWLLLFKRWFLFPGLIHEPESQDEKQGTHCEVLPFRPWIKVPKMFLKTGPPRIRLWLPMHRNYVLKIVSWVYITSMAEPVRHTRFQRFL